MYVSTRGGEKLTASKAILKGLACDGGLFIPTKIDKLNIDKNYVLKSYNEIAFDVLKIFLDDFTDSEINEAISNAYNKQNFNEDFCKVKDFSTVSFLELFYGPTLAFKDMALTMLPFLIEISKRKNKVSDKSLILVATSGDTGGAALSSFIQNPLFDTVVLYPDGGVSEIQEKQMLYYTNEKTKAIAVKGNFDDCQTFVKEVFASYPKDNGIILSSANSINIGRLIPQVIYYVYAYAHSVKQGYLKLGESFNVSVPTGNFGDIFAGYLAKQIGVPIKRFTCASNVNNVLTKFFNEGIYDKNREFYKSNSPAMDILISSNLERLLYYVVGKNFERVKECMTSLKEKGIYALTESERANLVEFTASFSTEEETLQTINKVFNKYSYLIDPHTAVAYNSYEKTQDNGLKTIIVSTASPFKFASTIATALNMDVNKGEFEIANDISVKANVQIPYGIKKLMDSDNKKVVMTKEEIVKLVKYENHRKVTIKVPCSTANLGCGFDCMGLSLSLYNTFSFESSEKDALSGFGKNDISNNLVMYSYKKTFEVFNKAYVPCKISMIDCQVPSARGLGSSATCIVAGVLGANYMLKNILTNDDVCKIITMIEGHPDNVVPCFKGGLSISVTKQDGEIINVSSKISEKLVIYALIPDFELSTKKARAVLPKQISIQDAISNMSRTAIAFRAFESADMDMIKEVFNDKLHQPYRFGLITGGEKVKKIAEDNGYAVAISGAGPTLLALGTHDGLEKIIPSKIDNVKWRVVKLSVSDGAKLVWNKAIF